MACVLSAYFDLSHASEANLPWISLYTMLAGQVDSRDKATRSFQRNQHPRGGISLGLLPAAITGIRTRCCQNCLNGKAVRNKTQTD